MGLAVENPEIPEVLNLETGEYLAAGKVIGEDDSAVSQLRLTLRTRVETGQPLYACPLCGVPVYLVARLSPEPRSHGRRFFFRHLIENGRCSAKTRGLLSQNEIDARKYNGAKESQLYRQMKGWLAECLRRDPSFSGVEVEATWKGALTGEIRRPDVRAFLGATPVAFEVQLSTTHLNVIAGRRLFYLREGGLLFWVFAKFEADGRRLTQDDVFFNNNRNAFIVSKQTVEASEKCGSFHLECVWAEPRGDGSVAGLYRRLVSFQDLTLELPGQRAYFFDYDGARGALAQQAANVAAQLRQRFESFWLAHERDGEVADLDEWRRLRSELCAQGFECPTYPNKMPRALLNAVYSAKYGVPIGWRFKTFIEVAHWVASAKSPEHLQVFVRALRVYDRVGQLRAEDTTGKWRAKAERLNAARREQDSRPKRDIDHLPLVAFLFPELMGA